MQPTNATRDIESDLVDQTKSQIRIIGSGNCGSRQIPGARPKISLKVFCLARPAHWPPWVVRFGCVIDKDEPLKLQYQINLKRTSLATDKSAQSRHSLLLNKLLKQGEPTLVSPHSGSVNSTEAGNPTEYLLVVGPLKINHEIVGLVEILQRPNCGTGHATRLPQICDADG